MNNIKLVFKKIGTTFPAQDGAVYNGKIFRLDAAGRCCVFSLDSFEKESEFVLDKIDFIVPHSNSVCFGDFLEEGDELPLLYTNVYNNYGAQKDRREGTCCVYRLKQSGGVYSSKLLQIIKIDFTNVKGLWCSENIDDVRPYGNFAVDAEGKRLYAFTAIDEERVTRIFSFALPEISKGADVESIVLTRADIVSSFDCEYVHFMQGATFYNGCILSVEGFTNDNLNPPFFRVFDVNKGEQVLKADLREYGLTIEPELIDAVGTDIFYSDCNGDFYRISTED